MEIAGSESEIAWARGGILATKEGSPDRADVFYGHHSYKGQA